MSPPFSPLPLRAWAAKRTKAEGWGDRGRGSHPGDGAAHPRSRQTLLLSGAALLALTLAALAVHVPDTDQTVSGLYRAAFPALLAIAAAVYLFAAATVLRTATQRAVPLILLIAFALRLPLLLAPPFLSSDVYRYVWDGHVQTAGINPYRYIPADPALAALRDTAIFPNINRADTARTIYPPMAQVIFQAVARVSPTVIAMKLAMLGFEALACWAILRVLSLADLPRARVLIYAWNPLAVWSFADNGHIDAAAIGLLGVALLLRATRRDGWAGAVLGAAILVKFLPAAIAPALWRRAAPWRAPLAALAVIAGLYLCYIGVGWHVLGFLPGYFGDENLTQGTGIWLLAGLGRLMPVTQLMAGLYAAATLGVLGALAAWIAFRAHPHETQATEIRRVCGDAALLAAALTVAISPHYPWYFVWLALPCCVVARGSIIWLATAPLLLYFDPSQGRFLFPSLIYLPAAALAVTEWRRSTRLAPPVPPKGVADVGHHAR